MLKRGGMFRIIDIIEDIDWVRYFRRFFFLNSTILKDNAKYLESKTIVQGLERLVTL